MAGFKYHLAILLSKSSPPTYSLDIHVFQSTTSNARVKKIRIVHATEYLNCIGLPSFHMIQNYARHEK